MSNYLITENINNSVVIRFTRPEIRNPLPVAMLDELDLLTDLCGDDANSEKVIFTGSDSVFASGADLREIGCVTPDLAANFALRGQKLMTKISQLPQTTIAAINGYCFGGALDLALACTRRIASSNAKFSHPGASLGIITGWGGTQRLPRLVGRSTALEMFFTADAFDADRALAIGLIDELSEDPLGAALEFSTF